MEKIQVTAFCVQELVLSGTYIQETLRILKPSETFQKSRNRIILRRLIFVNVVIIMMDLALVATEYANLYNIETTFKSLLYSVKLKLKFVVLNQLASIVNSGFASVHDPLRNDWHAQRNLALTTIPTAGNGVEQDLWLGAQTNTST